MTPKEINLRVKAFNEAENRKWEMCAWQTAHLMNIHLDRSHKIKNFKELLGSSKSEADDEGLVPYSDEEFDKLYERRKQHQQAKEEIETEVV